MVLATVASVYNSCKERANERTNERTQESTKETKDESINLVTMIGRVTIVN